MSAMKLLLGPGSRSGFAVASAGTRGAWKMDADFAHCEALVRAGDRDRFLATLFVPAERRHAVLAAYAFNLELSRVPGAVTQPLAGEIRLQWWRDVLDGLRPGEAVANPVAAALLSTVADYGLDTAALTEMIDARTGDLHPEPFADRAALETYADATLGRLTTMAGQILDAEAASPISDVARHVGIAAVIAGRQQTLVPPQAMSRHGVPADLLDRHNANAGEIFRRQATAGLRAALAEMRGWAHEHLAAARSLLPDVTEIALPALLPLALAPATLRSLERGAADPFAMRQLPAWRRQWLLWRAARRPLHMLD